MDRIQLRNQLYKQAEALRSLANRVDSDPRQSSEAARLAAAVARAIDQTFNDSELWCYSCDRPQADCACEVK